MSILYALRFARSERVWNFDTAQPSFAQSDLGGELAEHGDTDVLASSSSREMCICSTVRDGDVACKYKRRRSREVEITEPWNPEQECLLLRRSKEASGACSALKRGPSHGRDSYRSRNFGTHPERGRDILDVQPARFLEIALMLGLLCCCVLP